MPPVQFPEADFPTALATFKANIFHTQLSLQIVSSEGDQWHRDVKNKHSKITPGIFLMYKYTEKVRKLI